MPPTIIDLREAWLSGHKAARCCIRSKAGTAPGFYVIVGPNWKGDLPPGIAGVVRSSTDYAAIRAEKAATSTDRSRRTA
jgi:hypothetical protein